MILVVGATGRLGGTIARRLLHAGRDVRVLVRPGSDHRELVALGAVPVLGDLKEPQTLGAACRGVDAVVTTANAIGRSGGDTLETVDIHGNRHLIEAADAAGVDRFVFVSSLGADPDSAGPVLRAKGLTETRLRTSGMRTTILQPDMYMDTWIPMVLGAALTANEPVPLLQEGRRRHSFIALADVAAFASAVLDRNEADGQTIPIGGPDAVSWRDIVEMAERILDRPIPTAIVEPGAPPPAGMPLFVMDLLAMIETYDSLVDTKEACRTYGVDPTPVSRWMEGFLGAMAPAPVP